MDEILFNTSDEALTKLKKLNVLTKSKNIADLDKFLYKKKDKNGKVISVTCKVIGYGYK